MTKNILPVITLKDNVIFPHTEAMLNFVRQQSIEAIEATKDTNGLLIVVGQKNHETDNPQAHDLYTMGTLIRIKQSFYKNETFNALTSALRRVKIEKYIEGESYFSAEWAEVTEIYKPTDELIMLSVQIRELFQSMFAPQDQAMDQATFNKFLSNLTSQEIIDQIANALHGDTDIKQKILEELDVLKRGKMVLSALKEEQEVVNIEQDVIHKTHENFNKIARENILRERMKIIQQELGEIDDEEELADEYSEKLKKLKVPKEAREKIEKEIKRFRQSSSHNPESGYIRNWLDEVVSLPWGKMSTDKLDIKEAQKILDVSHYGLKEVKDRILEYIAVLQMHKKNKIKTPGKPTILCFVGPPGVGKTSIGKSIASAMHREFTKISLGGVRDEAEVRGHRRTYVGAMPGRIIAGMKKAKTMNPVFMLDELDKIGADYKGDPAAALLEVLDPEQNFAFEDHYLDMPFDLSKVIFIATANTHNIPPALHDRLEIIEYTGYTLGEKFAIARDHLWKKVIQETNLKEKQIEINDEMLRYVIEGYTKEAGVRALERQLTKIARKVVRELVGAIGTKAVRISTKKQVEKYLGPRQFDVSLSSEKDEVGVTTGMAWTSVGGDILFIEAAIVLAPDKKGGGLKLTGQLGDVMKESAQTAYTYIKAHAKKFGIPEGKMDEYNLHLHIPEGAIPKDGPSAGVTMATTMASIFADRKVRKEMAMTGEVTLRGKVLRIGGLKEKAIAAHRAGCTTIIIPKDNERDLVDMPAEVKEQIKFVAVENVEEVLERVLK